MRDRPGPAQTSDRGNEKCTDYVDDDFLHLYNPYISNLSGGRWAEADLSGGVDGRDPAERRVEGR